MWRTSMIAPVVLLAACGTVRGYDGPALPPGELATVTGDPPVSAGLPLQVILRKVDEREIPFGRTRVELAPGTHVFVVDCKVAESGSSIRFAIEEELSAGAAYRLEADATSRGCEAVRLRRTD